MVAIWTGIATAAVVFPVAFVLGQLVARSRARRDQQAFAALSQELRRVIAKAFPRPAQQYSTIRREEALELLELLDACDRAAGIAPPPAQPHRE